MYDICRITEIKLDASKLKEGDRDCEWRSGREKGRGLSGKTRKKTSARGREKGVK